MMTQLCGATHNPGYHKSVLVRQVIEAIAPRPGEVYCDATFGGGGHTYALLSSEPNCRVIACDWDREALDRNGPALQEMFPGRLTLLWGNFAQLPMLFKKHKIPPVQGILADFGTSQFQIMHQEGFSFSNDTPLDMRMSRAHYRTTAYTMVNFASADELVEILQRYGEEPHARKIVRAIEAARSKRRIATTKELAEVITSVIPRRQGVIHPATRTFQALRIAVNHELENIETFLKHAPQVCMVGGRLVCISFHSLEDRLVKQHFRSHAHLFEEITRKVVCADEEELLANPSSRSAKLRAAKILAQG